MFTVIPPEITPPQSLYCNYLDIYWYSEPDLPDILGDVSTLDTHSNSQRGVLVVRVTQRDTYRLGGDLTRTPRLHHVQVCVRYRHLDHQVLQVVCFQLLLLT